MASRLNFLGKVREVLNQKLFTELQIEKVIPHLNDELLKEPSYLAEIIDTWNILMGATRPSFADYDDDRRHPPMASPPKGSLAGLQNININNILADVEPDLLLFDPDKLKRRHSRIQGLGLAKNLGEEWLLLLNAPRGFYLQDWTDLSKKIYYIEHKLIDLVFDKKEQKDMEVHPIVKCAAITESDFDHIRTRYLFALRSGYTALSHMYSVQMALDRPSLKDIVLVDNESFLAKFAPFCSIEEYKAFSKLIKSTTVDQDDAEIIEKLAELDSLSH